MENICLTEHTNPLMYESIYKDYIFNKMVQEQSLQKMISAELIMTESTTLKTKERKLTALYEAKISDKIKSTWNKFIDFINSLFAKFGESITNIVSSYKDYLVKYKDIILSKRFKIKLTKALPGDYNTGVNRCNDVKIPVFQYNDQNMKVLLSDDDEQIVRLIIKDSSFEYDQARNLNDILKDYFLGIDKGIIDDLDKLKREDMYNFCLNADKIQTTQKQDMSALKSTTSVIERAITNEVNKVNTEAYVMEEDQNTGSNNNNNQGSNNNNNNNVAKPGSVNTSPINSSLDDDYKNKHDENDYKQDGEQAAKDGNNADNVTKAFDNWRKVCQSVITAKMTAQQAIAKDYMGIIRAHVRSYVGRADNQEDNEQAGKPTNYAKNNKQQNNNNNNNNNNNAQQNNNQNK